MVKGRKPMPVEQKLLLGNPGRRPIPDDSTMQLLPKAEEAPQPIRPLEEPGLAMWARVWDSGIGWIYPDSDIEILQLTCELIDERVSLAQALRGSTDPAERRSLRQLDAQIVSNLSLLGFTPTDRSRLGVARIQAESKLDKMRRRRDEK